MSDPSSTSPRQPPGTPHRARLALIVLALLLVALAVYGIVERLHAHRQLADDTDRDATPTVAVLAPKGAPGDQSVSLPGTVSSWQDAQIYARTTGYVAKWYVDIGTKVKKGQRLADLDTPDVDNQLSQGQAQMRSDEANAKFAQVTATRYDQLVSTGLVARQTGDQYDAQARASFATVEADRSNVARLENMEQFKHINAPFDGVITQRNLDVGALVDAGSTGSNLFVIADTSKLRVFVNVPEVYAKSVHVGTPVQVSISSLGDAPVAGTVARTADALDANSRTLRAEIDLDNANQSLVAGVYATVKLGVASATHNVIIPANTLLFRSEGLRVALVDAQNHVHLQPVTIGRDFGSTVEITEGIDTNARLVVSPPDSLYEGEKVDVAKDGKRAAGAGKKEAH
jgi:RND family efflux transporter MFP subunit